MAELLVRTGMDPQEALMLLVPEAFRNHPDLMKEYPEVRESVCVGGGAQGVCGGLEGRGLGNGSQCCRGSCGFGPAQRDWCWWGSCSLTTPALLQLLISSASDPVVAPVCVCSLSSRRPYLKPSP